MSVMDDLWQKNSSKSERVLSPTMLYGLDMVAVTKRQILRFLLRGLEMSRSEKQLRLSNSGSKDEMAWMCVEDRE